MRLMHTRQIPSYLADIVTQTADVGQGYVFRPPAVYDMNTT